MTMEMKLQMWDKTKGVNMNLDDLLKVNSVRCIKTKVHEDLVEGEIYKVEGFDDETIKIVDRNAFSSWHNKNLFEPVPNNDINLDELIKHLEVGISWKEIGCNHVVTITEIDSGFANNIMVTFESDCCLSSSPLRMFLKDFTPVLNNDMSKSDNEIDISENSVDDVNTNFKVGDKVYKFGDADVKTILEVFKDGYMNLSNYPHSVNHESICHATPENYERLLKLYPHIQFELPHKEITGSDLCRAMLDKGWHLVPCVVSDISDSDALNNDNCCLVDEWWVGSFDSCFNSGDYSYKYAVPFDPKTGIPLRQEVLNETINK